MPGTRSRGLQRSETNSPTVAYVADATPGMMKLAQDLVDSDSEAGRGSEAVDPLGPRARPTVRPGRRHVPGLAAPDRGGARGAEWLPQRRPPSPASGDLSVLVAPARRSLCLRSGSGTTEARPPVNSVTPPCLLGDRGRRRAHRRIPPGIFGAVSAAVQKTTLSRPVCWTGTKASLSLT